MPFIGLLVVVAGLGGMQVVLFVLSEWELCEAISSCMVVAAAAMAVAWAVAWAAAAGAVATLP